MDKITADAATLMRQGSMTAREYLGEAVRSINDAFGEGYAAKHPELVAAMVKCAASDANTAVTTSALQEIAEALGAIAQSLDGR